MDRLFLLFIMLCLSTTAYAKAVMDITPAILGTVTLSQTATIAINYNVLNNTRQFLNRFTIDPRFHVIPGALPAVSLKTNNCTAPLAPGATCTFQVQLEGSEDLPPSFILSPRVCAYTVGSSSSVCSQPIAADRTPVNVESVATGCSANGYGTGCFVMVSKNQMQGNMTVLDPAPEDAPDVSACNSAGSVSKADCICSIEGPAANNGNGTWYAWLGLTAGGNNNPRERLDNLLGHPAFPLTSSWVSLETGLTVYPNWGALGIDIHNYPNVTNIISAISTPVNTGGFNTPASTFAATCTDWTSASNVTAVDPGQPNGTVAANNNANSWNDAGTAFCDVYRSIYCTEVSP